MSTDVTLCSDSDWTGDKEETLTSLSTGVVLIGNHMLKACTRRQKIHGRSSSEADVDAAALGSIGAESIVAMMCDLGFARQLVLVIGAKATKHILHRELAV